LRRELPCERFRFIAFAKEVSIEAEEKGEATTFSSAISAAFSGRGLFDTALG